MTVQELYDYCKVNNINLNAQIALRSKDDYLLVPDNIYTDGAYFGNCPYGESWKQENLAEDDTDYEFIILDTESSN